MARQKALIRSEITADGLLADSVAAAEGKLYVQGGGWNMLNALTIPWRQPRIGIGLLLRVPFALANNMPRKFTLRLEDEDGHVIPLSDAPAGMPVEGGKLRVLEGSFTVGRPPLVQPGDDQTLPIAVNVDGLLFDKAGAYVFRFHVDSMQVKDLRFRVAHLGMTFRAQ
jgi:hypothetical protein